MVSEEDIVSPQLHKIESGVDCRVKVGRNVWPGKVAAVGKTVILIVPHIHVYNG